MAQQDAKRFFEALDADKKLAEEVRVKVIEGGASVLESYVTAAKELGYDFAAEELEAELKARQAAGATEVEVAELDEA